MQIRGGRRGEGKGHPAQVALGVLRIDPGRAMKRFRRFAFQIPVGGVAALTPVRERQAFELEFRVGGAGPGGTPMTWSCAESAGAGASWVSSIGSSVDAELPAGIEPRGNLLVLGPAEAGAAPDPDPGSGRLG